MVDVGSRLGQYEVLARLRAGGMGTLFLGQRRGVEGFSRYVAIKVIHGHLASDASFVKMFIDEAMLASRIVDPNVVQVEEFGCEDGTYFLAMEYVHGFSLAQMVHTLKREKRGLTVDVVVHLAAAAAAGLHAAHETTGENGAPLGVVHRDVSPHNVLVSTRGHVKLIDFGIAKTTGGPAATATGSLKGKIAYMAPEQAFGRSVDRRADVYALAILVWELLAADRLFEADNDLALLELVRRPHVPSLRSRRPDVPAALEEVLRAAMQPDRDKRTRDADTFRSALLKAVPAASALTGGELAALLHALLGSPPMPRVPNSSSLAGDLTLTRDATTAALDALTIVEPSATLATEQMASRPWRPLRSLRLRALAAAGAAAVFGAAFLAWPSTPAASIEQPRADLPAASPTPPALPSAAPEPSDPQPLPSAAVDVTPPARRKDAGRSAGPRAPKSAVRVVGQTPFVDLPNF